MKPLSIPDIESVRGDPAVFRALLRLREGTNGIIAGLGSGITTLVGGVAIVRFLGLAAGSVIVPAYQRIAGTPGTLYVDPVSYDLAAKTFVLRSTSATDTSVVSWIHWV